MASITQWFPSFHTLDKEHLTQCPAFCDSQNGRKIRGVTSRKIGWVCGMLPETLTRFQTKICDFLCPYFRPDQKFDTLFQPCLKKFDTLFQTWSPRAWRGAECMTSFYGTYTVVGVNIKREMVLSPNDEEVANSSKTHTQFNTRRHKPYPVSDQNSRNWYPVSNQKG